jgi:uncharacterized protein (TIGR02588 family)
MGNGTSIEEQEAHWIEWVTGTVCSLLVLSLIAFFCWEALTDKPLPPDLEIQQTSGSRISGQYRVTFDVTNRSTTTAAGVVVRGEIIGAGRPVESADVVFDYVAAQSRSSGAIFFSQEPGNRDLRIRPIGYTDP